MGNFKIICCAVLGLTLFSSCGDESRFLRKMVSLEEHEALIKDFEAEKKKLEKTLENYTKNEAVINDVVKELRVLTGATNTLRIDVELGSVVETKPEEIKKRLEQLKEKLKVAQNNASKREKQYLSTIKNLQEIIEQKEVEIETLKQEIERKDIEISNKQDTIIQQESTIKSQQDKIHSQQMDEWYKMGCELLDISSQIPSVRGVKDKSNIAELKANILKRARECFCQAFYMGKQSSIEQIKSIDTQLKEL